MSFREKENVTSTSNLLKLNEERNTFKDLYTRYGIKPSSGLVTASYDYDIGDRLKVKDRSEELRKIERDSKYRTRALLALR